MKEARRVNAEASNANLNGLRKKVHMSNNNTKPTIEILGATRPPENLCLKVKIPAEYLPGIGIEAEVVVPGLTWDTDGYWDLPRVSVASVKMFSPDTSTQITVTSGLWAVISKAVEDWMYDQSFDAIMSTAPHKEVVTV